MTLFIKQPSVYIITNKKNGTLYIGVTSNIVQRMYQHKHSLFEGFSKKYNCTQLVYFELYQTMAEAIAREKQLKLKKRSVKISLIEKDNSSWKDLSAVFFNNPGS